MDDHIGHGLLFPNQFSHGDAAFLWIGMAFAVVCLFPPMRVFRLELARDSEAKGGLLKGCCNSFEKAMKNFVRVVFLWINTPPELFGTFFLWRCGTGLRL